VIDLTAGTVPQLLATENRVCSLVWLNANLFVYDQLIDGFCRGVANAVKIWNTQTNEVVDTEISTAVQIIQRPEIVGAVNPIYTPTHTETPTATFTPTLTPTAASYQNLLLTSMCSPDPTSYRVWRVRNSNLYPVNFTWDLYGTAQSGSGTVPAVNGSTPGEAFFQTVTVAGANTTRIFVNGVLNNTKASSTAACATPTFTFTFTPTATDTPTYTPTFTETFTPTFTPTDTDTPTATATPTATDTLTSTATFTPTLTAAPYQNLLLTSMCSPDPTSYRVWRVRNSNPYPVNFTWDMYGTAQRGSGTVPAANGSTPGEAFFQTVTVAGANTTRIFVNGVLNNTKASTTRAC